MESRTNPYRVIQVVALGVIAGALLALPKQRKAEREAVKSAKTIATYMVERDKADAARDERMIRLTNTLRWLTVVLAILTTLGVVVGVATLIADLAS